MEYVEISGYLTAAFTIYNGILYFLPKDKAEALNNYLSKKLGPVARLFKFLASTPGGYKLS